MIGTERRHGERGVALLIALLALALLTVLVMEFTHSSQVGYRRAAHWLQARRAQLLAESGVTLAEELLVQDGRLTSRDSLEEVWADELPPLSLDEGTIVVRMKDEGSKFNLNRLASGARSRDGRAFQELLAGLELDPGLAAPLADWIDRNNAVSSSPAGAEETYYRDTEQPYSPRNDPLRTVAELALVKGFGPKEIEALLPYVTVFGSEDDPVNVNTAAPEVLRVLDPHLYDGVLVERIVAAREARPFASLTELRELDGMKVFGETKLKELFALKTRLFRIRSTGEVDGTFRSIEAVLERINRDIRIAYWLPRRGPNIVGTDPGLAKPFSSVGSEYGVKPRLDPLP